MRIAFLGPSHPWRGGIAQFAQNLAEKLHFRGHEIMMFTFIHQYPELLFPGSGQINQSLRDYRLPTQKVLTPYNPLTWLSAAKRIKHWHPDVVIISYWLPFMAPAFGTICRLLPKTRIIYLIHNAKAHEKWMMADVLTRYAFHPVHSYITLSDVSTADVNQLIYRKANNTVLQLYHPVYESVVTDNLNPALLQWKILFFGFVKHYKGLDILLEAFALAGKSLPDLKLVIAGDVYGDKQPYLDQINRLGISDKVVTHFKYISDEEIESYFTTCDVSVLPYRTATQSGVAQMSFAYNVPVIATGVGGIAEVVVNDVTGLLAEPENPVDLADKILNFYQNGKIDYYREEIRKRNKTLSWDNFTDKLLEFLI